MNVKIPFVGENYANSSPISDSQGIKQFAEYLSFEIGVKVAQKRIYFARTAKIQKTKYWLYRVKPLNEPEEWAFVHSTRVFFIIPTYCSVQYGPRDLSEEEVLLQYHWSHIYKKNHSEFSLEKAANELL